MLVFKPLTLEDIPLVRPYFAYTLSRACDNTVGGTFMWRDFFSTEFAFFNDTVIFKVIYFNGVTAFSMPLGRDIEGSLEQIAAYCERRGIETVFCTAAKEDAELYGRHFDIELAQENDWSDYLYNAEDIATFSGHRFNGQRNHINFFLREHPDWSFRALDDGNIAEVRNFYLLSPLIDAKDTPVFAEEQAKVFEVLDNFALYGMPGGALYAGGVVVAFAVGETVGDTLHAHIEKADASVRGAYQMIAREFARMYAVGEVKYINREEDVGDEGMRRSKLSYHPCEIIEKFTVKVKSGYRA